VGDRSRAGRITTDGDIRRYRDPRVGDPEFITTGPDGALWFALPFLEAVGRITTAGQISAFTVNYRTQATVRMR